MFFYIVLTPISTTSDLWSTGNTRKFQQIDVYIYQYDYGKRSINSILFEYLHKLIDTCEFWSENNLETSGS